MEHIRVLLADDHALVRAGIRNSVEEIPGLKIVGEAEDGPSLLYFLKQLQPDCLLIDVTMPNFDPIVTIREIRMDYPAMKILVVSAYDDDVYVQGLLRAGVDGYHLKDQPLSDLRLGLARVLKGERWISSPLVDKLIGYSDPPSSATQLTTRQYDILRLLSQGLDNQTIARQLNLSVKTIENHLTRLYKELGVKSRLEAVSYVANHPEILAFPLKDSASHPEKNTMLGHINLLLVDDNQRYRNQLRKMIGKICPQATIYEADTIDEVVYLIKQINFSLFLVDVLLGDENGIHCASRIKALSPQARIILISAYPDKEFHRQGLQAGAAAFLDKKAIDLTTLQQIIDDVAACKGNKKAK